MKERKSRTSDFPQLTAARKRALERRATKLMGCTENSAEERELKAIAAELEHADRPRGKRRTTQ